VNSEPKRAGVLRSSERLFGGLRTVDQAQGSRML